MPLSRPPTTPGYDNEEDSLPVVDPSQMPTNQEPGRRDDLDAKMICYDPSIWIQSCNVRRHQDSFCFSVASHHLKFYNME